MCVRTILDASAFGHLCSGTKNSAGCQLREWIGRGDGKVVYSSYARYAKEVNAYKEARELLLSFVDNGNAIDIDSTRVKNALNEIPGDPPRKSDDPHILALAKAGEATVLFSCDKKLRKDFANVEVIPKIGRQKRRSVPGLDDKSPDDTTKKSERNKFLNSRRCTSC